MNAHRRSRPNRDERGAILVLSTVGIVLAMIFSALAVDIGFLAADKRTNQKLADLAALDSSRDLPGVAANCSPPPTPSGPACPAVVSVARNFEANDPQKGVSAELVSPDGSGDYVADPLGQFVRVTVTSPRDPFFPFVGNEERDVVADAVAGGVPEAEFSVGSTLASIDTQKSVLDQIIGPMLGGVNMNAVSYDGLASGEVSLAALQQALLDMGYGVGTPDELLDAELDVADLLTAAAIALGNEGEFVAQGEINDIPINLIPNLETVSLGELISVSQPGSGSALDATINAFQLVNGAAQVANGTNFVSVPDFGISLPGVADIGMSMHVIQPAQVARGPVGVSAETSQVKMRLDMELLPVLLTVPYVQLDFTAGYGVGTLTEIICSGSPGITIDASTSGTTIEGVVGNGLLGSLTLNGTAGGAASSSLPFAYPSEFTSPEGGGGNPAHFKHVGVAGTGLEPTSLTVGAGGGLLGSLGPLVVPILNTALDVLDDALVPTLGPVLDVLGLDLAGADVRAMEIYSPPPSCNEPRLVK